MAVLSGADKNYLLSLKTEDINFDLLMNLIGDTEKKKSRMNTYDTFILKAKEYTNKTQVETNVGLFIYNKYILEPVSHVIPYMNTPVDSKQLKEIESILSKALLTDKITQDDYVDYLNKTQWLGLRLHAVLSGSFTLNTFRPNPKVIARRDKLFKDNKESLDNNDVATGVKIEKELTDLAREVLKDDPGLDLYNSGARGSFDNNFKNITIMRGPIYDPTTSKFNMVKSNFVEGMRKEEIAIYGTTIITGSYPKAVGTQVAGYLSKQLTAAMQSVVLDVPNSDCGTKGSLKVNFGPPLKNDLLYRYVVEGNKLVCIDDSNIDKYVGKDIKLRSPMYCIGKKLCNKCAGDMYYKLGLTNIGLTATRVSSTLLNLSLKSFHDSTQKVKKVTINELII